MGPGSSASASRAPSTSPSTPRRGCCDKAAAASAGRDRHRVASEGLEGHRRLVVPPQRVQGRGHYSSPRTWRSTTAAKSDFSSAGHRYAMLRSDVRPSGMAECGRTWSTSASCAGLGRPEEIASLSLSLAGLLSADASFVQAGHRRGRWVRRPRPRVSPVDGPILTDRSTTAAPLDRRRQPGFCRRPCPPRWPWRPSSPGPMCFMCGRSPISSATCAIAVLTTLAISVLAQRRRQVTPDDGGPARSLAASSPRPLVT